MAIHEHFSTQRINRKGVFDTKRLYREVKEYLTNLRYNITERDNQTKVKSKGNEIIVEFRAYREVDDYIKFWMNIDFLITETKPVKVGGKMLTKGYLQVTLVSSYELDYRNKWQKSKFADLMHKFYKKHIIKDRINIVYEGKIYGEAINLLDLIKENLDLYKQ